MIYSTTFQTNLGKITVAAQDGALTGLWLEGQKYYPQEIGKWEEKSGLPIFKKVKVWLDNYFAGDIRPVDFPLAPKGSDFRQAVWKVLLQIPCGKVTTYGEIAKKIAADSGRESMSAQAIGGAVGHNPISIIIPCHRVMGSDGSLTGYAGGVDKKERLLILEQANTLAVVKHDEFE